MTRENDYNLSAARDFEIGLNEFFDQLLDRVESGQVSADQARPFFDKTESSDPICPACHLPMEQILDGTFMCTCRKWWV